MSNFENNNNSPDIGPGLDTDLSGMDQESAYRYVLAFVTDLKNTQKKIDIQNDSLAMWQQRLNLATENNKPDLIEVAEEEIKKIKETILRLKKYLDELKIKVPVLKDGLDSLLIQSENRDNFEELLLQMQMINENSDAGVKKEFEKQQVEDELKKMKEDIKE